MKIRKTWITVTSALLMTAWLLPAAANDVEKDICSDWARQYVRDARTVYDLTPYDAQPQDLTLPVTPEQFTAYLHRICTVLTERYDRHGIAAVEPFSVSVPEGDTVSREQAALYLVQMAEHFLLPTHVPALIAFTDMADVSEEYTSAVSAACGMGLFLGDENGELEPQRPATREEIIALCIRLADAAPMYKEDATRTGVGDGLYTRGNPLMFWVENEDGEILRVWPMRYDTYAYRYGWGMESTGSTVIRVDKKILLLHRGRFTPEGDRKLFFCDPVSGEIFFTVSAEWFFHSVSADGKHLILRETRTSGETWDFGYSVYGVYDGAGTEIVPMGVSLDALIAGGWLEET